MPCENLFTRFLLQNKAERMQQTQRQFNVRLQVSNGTLAVKGEKDAGLFVYETVWHLLGKYYGSLKAGVINV